MLVSAAYALRTVGRLFTGPVSAHDAATCPTSPAPRWPRPALLSAASWCIGFYPAPALALISRLGRATERGCSAA
ncbi:MAG: hypothetical protein MZV65_17860 [Chromatiales bacterium]|nr:hypothetical protein [Chromatiales bacterium]